MTNSLSGVAIAAVRLAAPVAVMTSSRMGSSPARDRGHNTSETTRVPPAIRKLQPGKIELIPDTLFALIASGTIQTTVDGDVQCWNYSSEGLTKVGQQEVFLSIQKAPGEDEPPPDP